MSLALLCRYSQKLWLPLWAIGLCLRVMLAAFDRPLKHNNNKISLARDRRFVKCRQVREGKARAPREKGHGKRPKATKTLTVQDEELWAAMEISYIWRTKSRVTPLCSVESAHSLFRSSSLPRAPWNACQRFQFEQGRPRHRVRNIRRKPKKDRPRWYKKETKSDPASLPMKVPVFQSSS